VTNKIVPRGTIIGFHHAFRKSNSREARIEENSFEELNPTAWNPHRLQFPIDSRYPGMVLVSFFEKSSQDFVPALTILTFRKFTQDPAWDSFPSVLISLNIKNQTT
jgi:hypothetical protein